MKYWMGVVSENHVKRGVENGIAQVCHGKRAPLARMEKGDWLVYYSPSRIMGKKDQYQTFTAIGKILDDEIYTFDMGNGFVPFRRKIKYYPSRLVLLADISDQLQLTQESHWGMKLLRGLLELSEADFQIIQKAMGLKAEA